MDPIERIIGKLQAHHEDTRKRLSEIEKKIDDLMAFRWRWAGTFSIFAIFGSAVCELLIAKVWRV